MQNRTSLPPPPPPVEVRTWPDREAMLADRELRLSGMSPVRLLLSFALAAPAPLAAPAHR